VGQCPPAQPLLRPTPRAWEACPSMRCGSRLKSFYRSATSRAAVSSAVAPRKAGMLPGWNRRLLQIAAIPGEFGFFTTLHFERGNSARKTR